MQFDLTTSVLAGLDDATLRTMLSQAQAGLASLSAGGRPVTVIVTGGGQHREVTYEKGDLPRLLSWIRLLQAQLGLIPAPRSRARITYG